jgi:hypothetical protein
MHAVTAAAPAILLAWIVNAAFGLAEFYHRGWF